MLHEIWHAKFICRIYRPPKLPMQCVGWRTVRVNRRILLALSGGDIYNLCLDFQTILEKFIGNTLFVCSFIEFASVNFSSEFSVHQFLGQAEGSFCLFIFQLIDLFFQRKVSFKFIFRIDKKMIRSIQKFMLILEIGIFHSHKRFEIKWLKPQ